MPQRHSIAYLLLIITVLALPSVASLTWYHISRDPNLRPLGITEQALKAHRGGGEGVEIVALVDWAPPRTGDFSRSQLAITLQRAFEAKGVEVRVVFREGAGVTRVTYRVGRTVLGPYSTGRASEGIAAAVEAYHMH